MFKKFNPSIALAGIIVLLWISGSVMAQLQQSGGPGSTVTANQGGTWTVQPGNTANTTAWKVDGSAVTQPVSGTVSANASQTGTWTVQPGNTANTTAWKVDGSAVTQPVSGTLSLNSLPTGSNVIGIVNTIPKTACGNTLAAGSTLAAVPTSSTLLTSAATACVHMILMNNTNGSSVTVTVTDNTATPINDILTFSIPANSQLIQPLYGVAFNLGLKWGASSTGVTGAVISYQ